MNHEYDDIISLPHPTSSNHPRMSMYQRAAQFAPFAALTGHNAAINETARLTDCQLELSEDERHLLNDKISHILNNTNNHPTLTITYFVHDQYKEGGQYSTYTGILKKWDESNQELFFEDGTHVNTNLIIDIQLLVMQ